MGLTDIYNAMFGRNIDYLNDNIRNMYYAQHRINSNRNSRIQIIRIDNSKVIESFKYTDENCWVNKDGTHRFDNIIQIASFINTRY